AGVEGQSKPPTLRGSTASGAAPGSPARGPRVPAGAGTQITVRLQESHPIEEGAHTPMADAVIVSTARTGIGKAYRGAFNNTHGATLGGHVVSQAVKRAGVEPAEVEDVIFGCA